MEKAKGVWRGVRVTKGEMNEKKGRGERERKSGEGLEECEENTRDGTGMQRESGRR